MADTALAHRSFERSCRVCKLVPGPCGVSQCLFFLLWSHWVYCGRESISICRAIWRFLFFIKSQGQGLKFVVAKKWMVKLLDVKKVDAAGVGVAIHRGGMKKWLKRPGWLFHLRLLSSEMDTEMMSDIQRKARPLPAASAAWMAAISFPANRRKWENEISGSTFLSIRWTFKLVETFWR